MAARDLINASWCTVFGCIAWAAHERLWFESRVWAHSEVGNGVRFFVELPLQHHE